MDRAAILIDDDRLEKQAVLANLGYFYEWEQ